MDQRIIWISKSGLIWSTGLTLESIGDVGFGLDHSEIAICQGHMHGHWSVVTAHVSHILVPLQQFSHRLQKGLTEMSL